jgi:hypothetical protein
VIHSAFRAIHPVETMPPIPVDLHTGFTLSCMTDPDPRRRADCDEDEEEERDHAAALAKMQGRVPKRAYSLGVLGHTLADRPGYTWRMEEHLYLVPLRGGDSRWGLLRISWDDNECFDQWLDGAQLSGVSDPKEAALALVLATFDQWSVDLESEYDAGYAAFLDALRKKTLVRVGMEAKARAKAVREATRDR